MRHLCVAAWIVSVILAPPQQPTFRVQIDLVQVDVTATGPDGRFIADLKQEDFEVLEDGKPQQVATFQLVNVPIRGNAAAATTLALSAPDVRSNAGGTARVYLIVLDDVRTPFEKTGYGRKVASQFVERYMEPGDTGAVVFTSGRRDVSQEFTSDRRLLLASIDRFMGKVGDPGAALGVAHVADTQPEAAAGTRAVISTLTALSQTLGRVPGGRKACVYMGPGFPTRDPAVSAAQYQDLASAANRANVTFYTLDPAGLPALAEGASAGAQELDAEAAQDGVESSHEGLRWLAQNTGGFAVPTSANFDRPFERIRRETSSYYLLGYYPPQQKEGSTHRISVRVRRPGVTVRARGGYGVPRASARPSTTLKAKNVPAALLPALDTPLPVTGVRFSAAAAVFNGAPKSARWAGVVIEIEGRDLDTSGKGGAEVGIIALDRHEAVKGHDVRHVDLGLDPSGLERVRQAGLRVQARVPFDGDVSSLRVAVADSATPRVGSLTIDIDLPNFEKDDVSMSGLLLTGSRAAQVPTTNGDEELRGLLGAPASTRREFQAVEAISWMTEIYQKAGTSKDVRVTTVIEGSDKTRVFRREEQHPASEPRNARRAIVIAGQAPLADVPPGSYVLRVEALVAGASAPITREVPFLVRN